MSWQSISARDVKEALEQRILNRVYPPGTPLPSVRQLAAEFGCSSSTIGRALEQLQREGWAKVRKRLGAKVARRLPKLAAHDGDIELGLRRLALRWRLSGSSEEGFRRLFEQVEEEVFRTDDRLVFFECNPEDLAGMSALVQAEVTGFVQPMLIEDAKTNWALLRSAVILTPFFHLAEVRRLVPRGAHVLPLNFIPAPEVLHQLAALGEGARLCIIGMNERSRRRLEGIAHQYSEARVKSTTIEEPPAAVARLVADSEVVMTVSAAHLPRELSGKARRVITVQWILDPSTTPLVGLRHEDIGRLASLGG